MPTTYSAGLFRLQTSAAENRKLASRAMTALLLIVMPSIDVVEMDAALGGTRLTGSGFMRIELVTAAGRISTFSETLSMACSLEFCSVTLMSAASRWGTTSARTTCSGSLASSQTAPVMPWYSHQSE